MNSCFHVDVTMRFVFFEHCLGGPRALSFDLSFEFRFVFCVLRFVFCFVFSYLSLVFENLGGPRALSLDLCLAI